MNIHFVQGSSTSVRVEGNKELTDQLNVDVKNGKPRVHTSK